MFVSRHTNTLHIQIKEIKLHMEAFFQKHILTFYIPDEYCIAVEYKQIVFRFIFKLYVCDPNPIRCDPTK